MNARAGDQLTYVFQLLRGVRNRMERYGATHRSRDIAPYLQLKSPLDILDLANGRLRPQYSLLRAEGHRVVGIDLVNYPRRTRTDQAYRFARMIFQLHAGAPRRETGQDKLVCGNVGYLPFAGDSFDLVTSIAAFEHFLDVPRVVGEMRRVLRPGGVAWILVHLFTSPSGGHNVKLAEVPLRTLPPGIDAWDHLRKRRLPFHVPLNEWRRDQYIETFAGQFEVVKHYCMDPEGEHLLTPAIAAELAAYDRAELTCGAYIIVARKPV